MCAVLKNCGEGTCGFTAEFTAEPIATGPSNIDLY